MKSRISGNKGFTLVELLVALLITGILLATISSVFLMAQRVYLRGAEISYKQKSITNVETELQNVLAIATAVNKKNLPAQNTATKHYFNVGFNDKGQCVESIDGIEYVVDQIKEIRLSAPQKIMNYELVPNNEMSVHSGGIVMNNEANFNSSQNDFTNKIVLNQETKGSYLVIEYNP
ncbi:MAG: prepilin-type N-terminal cleavage/methylation domain-containing protein [Acetobacterium woodii]|nr:prepilin-type N-terminal cleavage/methylation domain-containing protein [Acetobacterium woodii]